MEGHVEKYKDYYKILEVDYNATDVAIRSNYKRLALKWHPDKHKGDSTMTEKFQEINEAYEVLSDPDKRLEYDEIDWFILQEYLSKFILTCNGLGTEDTWLKEMFDFNKLGKKMRYATTEVAKQEKHLSS